MVFSDYTKMRILSLFWQGNKVSAIVEYLVLDDEIAVFKQGVCMFLKQYATSHSIARKPGSGLPPKLSEGMQRVMHRDDETTATQLQAILAAHGIYVFLSHHCAK